MAPNFAAGNAGDVTGNNVGYYAPSPVIPGVSMGQSQMAQAQVGAPAIRGTPTGLPTPPQPQSGASALSSGGPMRETGGYTPPTSATPTNPAFYGR